MSRCLDCGHDHAGRELPFICMRFRAPPPPASDAPIREGTVPLQAHPALPIACAVPPQFQVFPPGEPCPTCNASMMTIMISTTAGGYGGKPVQHCVWCDDPRTKALRDERDELDELFRLRHGADMRAIARWRAESPAARDLRMPDQADLCVWLMGQLEAAQAELASIKHVDPGVGNSRGE